MTIKPIEIETDKTPQRSLYYYTEKGSKGVGWGGVLLKDEEDLKKMNFWKMARQGHYLKPLYASKKFTRDFVAMANASKLCWEDKPKNCKKTLLRLCRNKRLPKLMEYAKTIICRVSTVRLAVARRKFEKEISWKLRKFWTWCFVCNLSKVEHIHHIYSLKNGGSNSDYNLVGLCAECHAKIHTWMQPRVSIKYKLPLENKFDPLTQEYLAMLK